MSPRVCVVGGGLAGIAAALDCATSGAEVVLVERRRTLGGLATSVERDGMVLDNGQHVFLRCCTAYRDLLERIGAIDLVHLQRRLEVPVLAPGGRRADLRRDALPAPLHLARSLATYRHLGRRERVAAMRCALSLRGLDPSDRALDAASFGSWLEDHAQSPRAVERLWNLIALPTLNLDARDASLALAAMAFRTGLLDRNDAGDLGWATAPLRALHHERAREALVGAGVDVRLGTAARALEEPGGGHVVRTDDGEVRADAVVVATPPAGAVALGVLAPGVASRLGASPIVNVHLVFDEAVTDLAFFAAVGSPVQFVFDRTASCGIAQGQCLSISLSAADAYLDRGAQALVAEFHGALGELLPRVRRARLVHGVVTRERAATFRAAPGSATARPGPLTERRGVVLAGAWCDTGWPATMEGAVRSGRAAAVAALAACDDVALVGSPS